MNRMIRYLALHRPARPGKTAQAANQPDFTTPHSNTYMATLVLTDTPANTEPRAQETQESVVLGYN